MPFRRDTVSAGWFVCAPLPALVVGIMAMRELGVSRTAWLVNIAATALGLLIWAVVRRLPPPARASTRLLVAATSIVLLLLSFASAGVLGVYRWISVAGLQLHAAAIAAPLIVLCVATEASHRIRTAFAIAAISAIILALQPDAAQTIGVAAACAVVFIHAGARQPRTTLLCVALLLIISAAAFVRRDPLSPVAHVEEIFGIAISRGPGFAAMATVALLLLPVPFFADWYRHRRSTSLALGVYVAMTLLAPAWGTFPVPIMGYGASPILGYFIALALSSQGLRRGSRTPEHEEQG